MPRVYNSTRKVYIADRLMIADTFWTRLKGLLGRKELKSGEALMLFPCNSIHTLGMAFPIDVIFVNENGRVVKLVKHLGPFRLGPVMRKARYVIEAPAGTIEATGLEIGDLLVIEGLNQNSHLTRFGAV